MAAFASRRAATVWGSVTAMNRVRCQGLRVSCTFQALHTAASCVARAAWTVSGMVVDGMTESCSEECVGGRVCPRLRYVLADPLDH